MRATRAPLRPGFSSARLCHVVYAGVLDGQMETILKMYPTSHFGFAAVASGDDLEPDVIAFNINTGMLRQKGPQTIARPLRPRSIHRRKL